MSYNNPLKATYASMPLSIISDTALPNLALVSHPGTTSIETEDSAGTASPSQTQLRRNMNLLSRSSFVPEFVWNSADIPLSQTEDIGVPRIYFCEPASSVYATKKKDGGAGGLLERPPRATFVMVTYHQIVIFENNLAQKQQSLACTIELNDYRHTRVQQVVKDDGRDTSFALVSFDGSGANQKNVLISFLDVVSRNFFIQVCDQVAQLHCNKHCCTSSATPEHALDLVMNQQFEVSAESPQSNNNLQRNNISWRVPILPFSGLVIEDTPTDPAELLHRSLKNLLEKRNKRTDEDDEDHHNHILDRDALRAIQMPFRTLAVTYEEQVESLQRELDQMREADEKKVKAAETTLTRSLASLEEKKDVVRKSAATAGEQLAEWLAVLQEKQSNELDATVRLSQKKQEYAKELDEADAQLTELYNERRWIEAESSKFSAVEYVQLLARRDALHQALDSANRAVDAELKEAGSSTIFENNENDVQGQQQQTRQQNQQQQRSISTISSEASHRNVSLFSPTRVFKMYSQGSPARSSKNASPNNQNNNNSGRRNKNNNNTATTNSSVGKLNTVGSVYGTSKKNTSGADAIEVANLMNNTAVGSSNSLQHTQLANTPRPRFEGLNKPVKIDQSVQQTLHVNATLRKLLETEHEGAKTDKKEFAEVSDQVKSAEAKLQEILNDQALVACDIQRVEGENGFLRSQRLELEQQEQMLLQQLNEAGSMRGGLLLAAETDRDDALEQRMKAESAMRQRKKESQRALFDRTHEMLKANLRSMSVKDE